MAYELTISILQTLFLKEVIMNKVLCLKFLYQNARWNSPESRWFDLRIQNLPGEDPRTLPSINTIFNSA